MNGCDGCDVWMDGWVLMMGGGVIWMECGVWVYTLKKMISTTVNIHYINWNNSNMKIYFLLENNSFRGSLK